MILRPAIANENHWEREGTTEVAPSRTRKAYFHRSSSCTGGAPLRMKIVG